MDLLLANGWKQIVPKDISFDIVLSNQTPEQNLVVTNTSFSKQKKLGHSGGINCPLATDKELKKIYISVDGITSFEIQSNKTHNFKIDDDFYAVWMLEYMSDKSMLLMHLSSENSTQKFIAWLDLESSKFKKRPLPTRAFYPLCLNTSKNKILYSTQQGAAIFDLEKPFRTIAEINLQFQPTGGAFDTQDDKVFLGGNGIIGWDSKTGELYRFCDEGSYPVLDHDSNIWFTKNDGAVAKICSGKTGFETIIELSGIDNSSSKTASFSQPMVFTDDGRYALVRLTGKIKKSKEELKKSEAFCKSVGQPFSDSHHYHYSHYFCFLDLESNEVWCHQGFAHNIAWVAAS